MVSNRTIDIINNTINVIAALFFLIGSILFLFVQDQFSAIWLFIIGSVFFLIPPVNNLIRLFGFIHTY